jgi:hypothetical protein
MEVEEEKDAHKKEKEALHEKQGKCIIAIAACFHFFKSPFSGKLFFFKRAGRPAIFPSTWP